MGNLNYSDVKTEEEEREIYQQKVASAFLDENGHIVLGENNKVAPTSPMGEDLIRNHPHIKEMVYNFRGKHRMQIYSDSLSIKGEAIVIRAMLPSFSHSSIFRDVPKCPRCEKEHREILFNRFHNELLIKTGEDYNGHTKCIDYWTLCPETFEPILLSGEEVF